MANNIDFDLWVAGETLPDVGGQSTTGMDRFVAGELYLAITTVTGPSDPFVGEAGGELRVTAVAAQRTTLLEAGGALQVSATMVVGISGSYEAGAELSHTVTIQGVTSAVTFGGGSELYAVTRKFVAGDIPPGSMARLGVGL